MLTYYVLVFFVGLMVGMMPVLWLTKQLEAEVRSHVQVGDLWEWVGPPSRFFESEGFRMFEVERANSNTEAGPDSWVMRSIETKRICYMHHGSRLKGNWILAYRDGPMRRPCDMKRSFVRGA